jgi:polyphosphate kinase
MEEGLRAEMPALERLKFLSIVASNFDEFFMIRVAALKRSGSLLQTISARARSIMARQYAALVDDVFPALAKGGLSLLRPKDWQADQREYLESFFAREIYPILTPLRVGALNKKTHDKNDDKTEGKNEAEAQEGALPSIGNYSLYVAFLLKADSILGWNSQVQTMPEEIVSITSVPASLERLIWLPDHLMPQSGSRQRGCVLLEDLIEVFGSYLYPGHTIKESLCFKVNRDADFSVDEKRDEDFIVAMEEVLEGRETSMPVRMVYSPGSAVICEYLARRFFLTENDLYEVNGPMNPGKLYEIFLAQGFEHLAEKAWPVYQHPVLSKEQSMWDQISAGDIILHLPYQSFDPVVRFFREAATDPQVAAIKTTLYRTSGNSPIVQALEQASLAGKHVTAILELKARFDEGRNISWAHRLEKAGVVVVYGLANLKIHAKAAVVMRRENSRIKRYVHLSTGNYNDKTARIYEDISLFTAREDIAYDAGILFNMVTGYSAYQAMSRLVIAPTTLKRRLMDLIARETDRSRPDAPGKIMAKMNALADPEIIWALYRASQKGVNVLLNVRGICMLTPGVKGLSENIRVISVIDHYLEHSRIYYFANGGADELYLASADWMPRNLDRRVELMFPVVQDDTKKAVFNILSAYFQDNSHAWLLESSGNWSRLKPAEGERPFRAQTHFHAKAAQAYAEKHSGINRGEFIVRRSPPGSVQDSLLPDS